jgi:hypothetical protein
MYYSKIITTISLCDGKKISHLKILEVDLPVGF